MSILIEGLTLPPVGVRQCVVAVSGGHLLISDVCGNTLFEGKYIEISTPHGRLIDADAYQYSGDLIDEPTIIETEVSE